MTQANPGSPGATVPGVTDPGITGSGATGSGVTGSGITGSGATGSGITAPGITVPLYRAAHGRTGDKGNRSNISVIAWHPRLWPILVEQVTEAAVAQQFSHRQPSKVARYLLPNLQAMNFVLDDVLDGGVNDSLNLDSHGKSLAYLLLDLPVSIPAELMECLVGDAD